MKTYRFALIAFVALLILAAAWPAQAQTRYYNFTWSTHSFGRQVSSDPPAQGDTTGFGIARVAPSPDNPGGVTFTFNGTGGGGHGLFQPPDASGLAQGEVEFPTRVDVATGAGTPAGLKFFGPSLTEASQFIVAGFFRGQGGTDSFWGAASPLVTAIANPLWNASVSGTVNVKVEAGLPGVPLIYRIAVDDTLIFDQTVSDGSATVAWDTKTVAVGSHSLSFEVHDTDGTAIDSAFVPVVVQSALTASIPVPAEGATVFNTATVSMASSGAGSGSVTYTLFVDGGQVFTGATTGGIAFDWNTRSVADGSHTLRLDIVDSAGRTASATRHVTVANGVPAGTLNIAFTAPAAGETVTGVVWDVIWVESASGSSNTFTLSVDGRVVATRTTSGRMVSVPWNSHAFANGPHTMSATVKDGTGNTGSGSRSVNVGN